jgi:hypothetical protein
MRNRQKVEARNAVRVAVDNGTLVKKDRCERADGTCDGALEAHHPSYERENWLKVEWLCVSHHRRCHPRKEPAPRLELGTARLRIECSTTELSRPRDITEIERVATYYRTPSKHPTATVSNNG